MTVKELNKEYDKLQYKYGAKELNSIYNGGCELNPDILFIFMNPTGRNIASYKEWNGRRSPWIGTKNIWKLFYILNLLYKEIEIIKPKKIICFGNQVSSIFLGENINVSKCRKQIYKKDVSNIIYDVYPVFYPVGNGMMNIDKAIEDLKYILNKSLVNN